MRVVVTGGAGFIGSALVRRLVLQERVSVLNIDKMTYAGSPDALRAVAGQNGYRHLRADITDGPEITRALLDFRPDLVFHLAAETHVDRSLQDPGVFVQTNVVGTYALLEAVRSYWNRLPEKAQSAFRFIHVSTDEVFGSLEHGAFSEASRYQPNSPYSATKAASDHLVRAWHHSFKIPALITHCSNNFGPHQFPEKLIPLMTRKAWRGERLPVYGTGRNVRDWLFVDDHVDALWTLANRGRLGDTYCIGGECEKENLEVVRQICDFVDELAPGESPRTNLISLVTDRPGHDLRYAMDISKLRRELGWQPRHGFASALRQTVAWYLQGDAR